jgi:multiple sugar transport system permease protein
MAKTQSFQNPFSNIHLIQDLLFNKVIPYALMTIIGITMLAPFVWMVSTSLKEQGAVFTYPPEWVPRTQVMTVYNGVKYPVFQTTIEGKTEYFIRLKIFKENADVLTIGSWSGIRTIAGVMTIENPVVDASVRQVPGVSLKPFKKFFVRFRNYIDAWKAVPFPRFYMNSIIVAFCVTFGQVLTSSLAAFAFARLEFPGRDKIFLAYLATMMIPGQVTMIPVFILLKKLGWIDTYQALILPGLFSAYGTFLLRQFFLTIPKDLEDAAVIDGCGKIRIWWTIIIPLSKAALATLVTFIFMGTWNDFMWPLIVTNSMSMKTLPVGLASFQGLYTTDWTLLMAASMIVLIPVLVLYIFNQRFFTEGIVLSGLKS